MKNIRSDGNYNKYLSTICTQYITELKQDS